MIYRILIAAVAALLLAACSVNPVTGKTDLILVSGAEEIAMGQQNYAPMRQSQGGIYDIDPELTRHVSSIGSELAAASEVDLPYEFVILNNSVPNAWALPGGKIAINRGLLTELNSDAELAAVLGHEIVHAAARHTAQQMSKGMLMQGVVAATSIATSDSGYGDLAIGGAAMASQLISMKYGRDAELESDKYGMRIMSRAGYDPQGAVSLQETFVRLSEGSNEDWLTGLFASHPPSAERVAENRKTANKLPPGGKKGVESYAAAMEKTMAAKPAYEAYDKGRKALSDRNTEEALALAEEALSLFPEEANFHALRGDVRLMEKQYDKAITNYDRAIARRGDFFYYYMQRGIAKSELGQADSAIADLETSLEFLPTAPAHLVLGDIKRDEGRIDEAVEHYKIVAKSGGDIGDAAYERLAYLDLERQPSAYIASSCGADISGQISVQVRNDTPLPVTGVEVLLRYLDASGSQIQRNQSLSGELSPGRVVTARTGLSGYPSGRCESVVTRARPASAPSDP
jgi:predicted Zn-dependent protease